MFERPCSRRKHIRLSKGDRGDLLVYDVKADAGHVLNPSAAVVYDMADGSRTVKEIAACLPDRVGLPADEQVVRLALQQLEKANLLESETATVSAAAWGPHIGRRDLIKQLVLLAPAVALLPRLASVSNLSQATANAPRLAGESARDEPYGYYTGVADVSAKANVGAGGLAKVGADTNLQA